MAAADVDHFHLAGPRGGYVVVLAGAAGRAGAQRVARQPSAPRAGPTLVVGLPGGGSLRARIAPAADAGRRPCRGRADQRAMSRASSARDRSASCSKRSA